MPQRNRSALAALLLGAVLVVTIASPAGAAGLQAGRFPARSTALGALERAWDWLASLLAPEGAADVSSRQAFRWEKEGTAINPDGTPVASSTTPPATTTGGGSTLAGGK